MFRVLVFPSCNEPGLEIVRALIKSNKVEVLGGSSFDQRFDPSRLLLRNHLHCPVLGEPDFKARFLELLLRHQVDTVFPTTDSLALEFSNWQQDGVSFITPGAVAASIFISKTRTYEALRGVVPVPEIYSGENVPLPCYAKPDASAGTRGHRVVRNKADLAVCRNEGLVFMEYLPGEEYTLDCLNDPNGNLLFCGPRLRRLVGRGIALGVETRAQGELESLVRAIAGHLDIRGPWFAQFKRAKNDSLVLVEVNGRIGGSSTVTRLAGVNIPLLALFVFKGYPVKVPTWRTGMVVNRCLYNLTDGFAFQCAVWDLDDTLVRKDGKPDPDAIAALYDCHNRGIRQFLVTKNPDPMGTLARAYIPNMFCDVIHTEDKPAAIAALLRRQNIAPQDCVFINDSNTERLALEALFPGVRIVGPDSVEALGRERL